MDKVKTTLSQDIYTALHATIVLCTATTMALLPLDLRATNLLFAITTAATLPIILLFLLELPYLRTKRVITTLTPIAIGIAILFLALPDIANNAWYFAAGAIQLLTAMLVLMTNIYVHKSLRPMQMALWIYLLLSAILFVTCLTSTNPALSYADFATKGHGLHIVLLALFAAACIHYSSPRWFLRINTITGGAWLLASLTITALFLSSNNELRLQLQSMQFVRDYSPIRNTEEFRVQFPFLHHNRLALYAIVVGFAALIHTQIEEQKKWRAAAWTTFAASLFTLLPTLTRGAWIAALSGIVIFLIFTPNKIKTLKILLPLIAFALLLAFTYTPTRQRISTYFDPQTYSSFSSTVVLRTNAFRAAWEMGIHNPLAGIGYGPANFQAQYTSKYMHQFGDRHPQQHAHNNFLEIWAGSGTIALIAYTCFLCWIAIILYKSRKKHPAALALFAAILIYSLSNTTTHQALGALAATTLLLTLALIFHGDECNGG